MTDNEIQELCDASDTSVKPLTPEDSIKLQEYLTSERQVYLICCWLADRDGVDDPHHLIYEKCPGEPWGEVWQKYEYDAKSLLKIILDHSL
jgi:hypothetical protein